MAAPNCCQPETFGLSQCRDSRPISGQATIPDIRANQPFVGGQGPLMRRMPNPPPPAKRHQAHPAIARLKPALRDTAVLVAGQQLTHAEAAEILGVAEKTVAWRMHEVRRILSGS